MEVHLTVLLGNNAGAKIKVVAPKFYVGRSEDCQLRPRSDLISRHHCAFVVEGTYVAVRDFGSKNGTYVNGARISGECELKPGDRVRIGPLEFEICFDLGRLGGEKRPPVADIKEAAARTADSGIHAGQNLDEADLAQWLHNEMAMDTGKITDAAESTIDGLSVPNLGSSADDVPPSKPGKEKPDDPSSDEAAAAMLRKLRRYR